MSSLTLPATDLRVFPISLGTVPLGSVLSQADSFRMLDAYAAAGGNFIDTASVYANWLPVERSISEKTIGAWLRQRGVAVRVVSQRDVCGLSSARARRRRLQKVSGCAGQQARRE